MSNLIDKVPILTKALLLLIILLVAVPVYSGPKEKVDQPQGIPVEVLSDQECDKGVAGKGESKCVPKEIGTAKKKVVKKAGTAAVVGVAGNKASSGIKDKVSGD